MKSWRHYDVRSCGCGGVSVAMSVTAAVSRQEERKIRCQSSECKELVFSAAVYIREERKIRS